MTACARPRLLALCDFNGTIVDRDMLVVLASQAGADPSPYEQGTRADIDRLAQLLTIGRDEAERRIERGVQFDASFGSFVRACAGAGVLLVVVSSGIRELIERYLARRGIYLPLYASEAEMRSDGWRMRFHDDSPSGIDKAGFVRSAQRGGSRAVVIGDDRSDFEAVLLANVVFAKADSALERFLRENGRECRSFATFAELLERRPPATWGTM